MRSKVGPEDKEHLIDLFDIKVGISLIFQPIPGLLTQCILSNLCFAEINCL